MSTFFVFAEDSAKLPRIIIQSTQNGGSNDFVTEPVAKHVKEAQKSWFDYSKANLPDPWYEACAISTQDEQGETLLDYAEGQVKVRGNWTTNYDKKSLRIKFDKKQNMLNLHNGEKYKNWVLLACWKDSSLLRDAVAFKMYKTMFPEYYVSEGKLVDVYINNEYWGVYLLAEQQETKKGRVAITEPDKDYKGTDIGYFIELDSYSYTEAENERFEINYIGKITDYYGEAIARRFLQSGYTIKSDVYDSAQKSFIQNYMNNLWKICYNAVYKKKYYRFKENYTLEKYKPAGKTDDEKCKNCISQIIDLKSLADMYIYNEIVCDPDIYLTSFFMDIDFGQDGDKLLRFEAPWDFDSTMGNKCHCANARGMFAGAVGYEVNYEQRGTGNPWMFIFIKQNWFRELVKSEWENIKVANPEKAAIDLIDSYSVYSQSFEFNRERWGNPGEDWELCEASQSAAQTSWNASAEYLKSWLTKRFEAVDQLFTP